MIRKLIVITIVMFMMASFVVGCGGGGGSKDQEAAKQEEITVKWATIAGFYTDWAEKLAKEYEEKTGVKVEIVQIDNAVMYEKQGIEMASHTGAYDLVTCESMWKAEWANAGYIMPIDDLIAEAGLEEDLKNFDPLTLKLAGQWNGKTYALPYYTYNQGMFVRKDLFDDPIEKERFKKEYGEELRIPDNYDYFYKVAEFFTRKPGDTLKGQKLEKPFYGVGLMAGRFPEIQDEMMGIIWAHGGEIMDENFNPVVNNEIGVKCMELYTKLVDNCAPPGARTSSYDEVVAQMKEGLIAMTGPFFLDQWPNVVQTEKTIPGAKVAPVVAPGGKGYIGAFGIAICKDSKHPKEAFDFLAFMMSRESQKKFAMGGGSTIRLDVLTDPEVIAPEMREKTGHFPTLVKMMELQRNDNHPIFDTPAAGKIYEEMMIHMNMACNHEKSAKEALDMLAKKMEELHAPFKK